MPSRCSALIDTIDFTVHSVKHQDGTGAGRPRFFFRKNQRLLTPADYSSVFSDAQIRVSHPSFLILARPNNMADARIGLVVAKKHVRRAHQRNSIKRMARESFRLRQHKLPAIDAIVLARRGAGAFTPGELTVIFNGLWKRIIKHGQSLPSPE